MDVSCLWRWKGDIYERILDACFDFGIGVFPEACDTELLAGPEESRRSPVFALAALFSQQTGFAQPIYQVGCLVRSTGFAST
jgi:hypothetical protein